MRKVHRRWSVLPVFISPALTLHFGGNLSFSMFVLSLLLSTIHLPSFGLNDGICISTIRTILSMHAFPVGVCGAYACVCVYVGVPAPLYRFLFRQYFAGAWTKKKWKKISSIETSAKYDHAKSALIFVFAPNIIMVSWFSLVWTCCRIYFCFLPPILYSRSFFFLLGCIENERVFVHLQSLSLRKSSASMRNKCMLIHKILPSVCCFILFQLCGRGRWVGRANEKEKKKKKKRQRLINIRNLIAKKSFFSSFLPLTNCFDGYFSTWLMGL